MQSDERHMTYQVGDQWSDPLQSEPETRRLRVIVLTHGGAEEVFRLLLSLEQVDVVGVFVETDIVRLYGLRERVKRSVRYDGYVATAVKLARKLFLAEHDTKNLLDARQSRDELRTIAKAHQIPFHLVANYHAPDSIALMHSTRADLGVIYGTNIIKETVFKIPHLGSINLHQGLAPYYRGGPPVFWELFNGEPQIGLTVHYVEAKVDSGAIILQDTLPLEYDYRYGVDYESFIKDFCEQLRPRSGQLIAEAVRQIALGTALPKPQDSSLGRRYRLPLKPEKEELRRRLRKRQQASKMGALRSDALRSDETSNA